VSDFRLLEDGSSKRLLEDGASFRLLEPPPVVDDPIPQHHKPALIAPILAQ
jgi:hypothetical protein